MSDGRDYSPWAEIVRPLFPDLVRDLRPSPTLLDYLFASKLIERSEMKALEDTTDLEERSRILLADYLPRRTESFLPFCEILIRMDDSTQKQIGHRLRDAFDSQRGPQFYDSIRESEAGQEDVQTPTISSQQVPTPGFSFQCQQDDNLDEGHHSERQTPSKHARLGEVSPTMPYQVHALPQTTEPTETVSHCPAPENRTVIFSNVENVHLNINPTVSRHVHYSLPSGVGQLYAEYDPSIDEVFVGRDDLVMSLTDKLSNQFQNLVMVSGRPGIGKTSIANAVCVEYLKQVPNSRCYWIQLNNSVETMDSLYELLCSQLLPNANDETPSFCDLSKAVFRALPPTSLLVVDACEQATSPDLISSLLCDAISANGRLRFLLTSQVKMNKHQLQVQALHAEPVESLNKEDSLKVLRFGIQGTLDERALKDLENITDLLDGVPLALSLASTMFRYLQYTPRRLLARLEMESPLSVLSDNEQLGKGLKTVIVEFFELLRQQLGQFEYLAAISASIFPGTISQEAFQSICLKVAESCQEQTTGSINPELIGRLTQWHVLDPCRGAKANSPRYQMHKLIKEYAKCQLKDLSRIATGAFLAYFARLLKKIAQEEETRQGLQDPGGLFALDQEFDNVSGFLTCLTDSESLSRDDTTRQIVLETMTAEDVGHLLSLRFHHARRLITLKMVYSNVKTKIPRRTESGLLLEMAKVLRGLGRFEEALSEALRARQLCNEVATEKERQVSCLEVVGSVQFRQHRSGFMEADKSLVAALQLAEENLRDAKASGIRDNIRRCTRRVASVFKTLGELRSRQQAYDDANSMFEKAELHFGQLAGSEVLSRAWLKHRIGGNYQTQDRVEDAEKAYLAGLDLCRKYKADKHAIYVKLNYSLGRLYSKKKNWERSLEFYQVAQLIQESLDNTHPDLAQIYIGIGRACNMMVSKDPQETIHLLQRAQKILEDKHRKPNESNFALAELHSTLALTYRKVGRFQEEMECSKMAFDIYNSSTEKGDSLDHKKANCARDIGNAYKRLGNKRESDKWCAKMRRLRPKGKSRRK